MSPQKKGLDLKEEIIEILKEKLKPLTIDEITNLVNKRGNYEQLDGSPISNRLIENKIKAYPQFFIYEKNFVSLIDWENLGEIRDILLKEKRRLTTKEIAEKINENKSNSEEKITAGQVYLRVKRYRNLFLIEGDEIELIQEELIDALEDQNYIRLKEKPEIKIGERKNIIKEIGVGNFKAFADKQKIKIKPITLIFGPNSSGKSSIIHSILYIQNAFATGDLDPHYMQISGQSVDLGGFKQFVYKRRYQNRIVWSIKLSADCFSDRLKEILQNINDIVVEIEIGQGFKEKTKEVFNSINNEYEILPTGELIPTGKPKVYKYDLYTDGSKLLQTSLKSGNRLSIDFIDLSHHSFQKILKAIIEANTLALNITDEDMNVTVEAASKICTELYTEDNMFIPQKFQTEKSESAQDILIVSKVSKETRAEDLTRAIRLHFPRILNEIFDGIYKAIEKTLGELIYLGPLRSYPERHIAFTKHNDPNWQAGGGLGWEIARDNDEVREKVNLWLNDANKLRTPYRLELRELIDIKSDDLNRIFSLFKDSLFNDLENEIDDFSSLVSSDDINAMDEETIKTKLNDFLEQYEFEIGKLLDDIKGVDVLSDLVLVDQRSDTIVSHRDVGIGVSQVLPVLVYAYANRNKFIAIEQPEIHLHPALQAELADVFIQTAIENNNTYILETHSEHFILRLLRRIREGYSKSENPEFKVDDISVIYVKPTNKGAKIYEIPVTKDGDFEDNWPDGFFPERGEELFL